MTWLEFIAALIGTLAWPLAAAVIAFVLRNPVADLIRSLVKLKYKDLELEFGQLKAASEALPEPPPELGPQPAPERALYTSLNEQIEDIAPRSPAGAILIAWSAVETALHAAVSRLAISPDPPSSRSPMHNLEQLEKQDLLDKVLADTIHRMRMLRNGVAHQMLNSDPVSVANALEYGQTASKVARTLQRLRRE